MHREPFEEAMQRVGAAGRKVWAEAVPADILWEIVSFPGGFGGGAGGLEGSGDERTHFVFFWERGNGAGGKFPGEHLVEEDKVGEAAADTDVGFLEDGEVGLVVGRASAVTSKWPSKHLDVGNH